MRAFSGDELLALPVRLHGVQLGRPTDLLLDREALRGVGLEVVCGDEVHRFLPLATAALSEDQISIPSPLVLLEEDELAFYRSRTLALSSLRGRPVERQGRELGVLRDVVLASNGELVALIVEKGGETKRVPFDGTLRLAPQSRTAA
jgi:sporulation protein YlmC with PRC-barrel domain